MSAQAARRAGRHRLPTRRPRRVRRALLRTTTAVVSVLAMLLTGAGYWVAHGTLGGITISRALSAADPHSVGGEMNILLMGLDSRKDQDGNDLPEALLEQLHAGDSEDGGYNTNTLILVHVGADNAVVAFSIPRDDYIPFTGVPGYDHIKIKEAYGLTKAYTVNKLIGEGVTDERELETEGREAGRVATLRAVRNLTGVPIDYFAEVNLAGFFDLTESLGGVDVCLNHAVYDEYSGADFPAGHQRLTAGQALAFVRQRHGLPNGDLDRTHRQQAFLVSVMHELKDSGTFTDLGRFKRLMAVVRRNVVLSAGWGEDQLRRMEALAGGPGSSVEYRTLPVVRYDVINGQDVNIIDPAAIKAEVAAAIGAAPPTTASPAAGAPDPDTEVEVVNAGETAGLASTVAAALTELGYTTDAARDVEYGEPTGTAIGYGSRAQAEAHALGELLGIDVASDPDLPAGGVRITLGPGYYPPALDTATTTPPPTAEDYYYEGDTDDFPVPREGGPIEGGRGVPCVN